jgi:hypothetical protein
VPPQLGHALPDLLPPLIGQESAVDDLGCHSGGLYPEADGPKETRGVPWACTQWAIQLTPVTPSGSVPGW